MKIHSDTLTREDFTNASQSLPHIYPEVISQGSRSRSRGFTVHIAYYGEKTKGDGRRYRNSGHYGAEQGVYAASWDEWGTWIDYLFSIDPNAIIGYYKGREDFMAQTSRYIPKGMKAPWLNLPIAA